MSPRLQGADEVVVVGPAPPLRGGIAAHTARLVEHLREQGREATALSWSRLYPAALHPGRSQRTSAARPPWCEDALDLLVPSTWATVRRRLSATQATVLLQWWHPIVAPTLLAITRGLPRERLVAVCHNVLPHEPLPGAAAAARSVLSRCGRVLCHGAGEAEAVRRLVDPALTVVVEAELPCLVDPALLRRAPGTGRWQSGDLGPIANGDRVFIAAGHLRPYKGTALLLRAWLAAALPADARLLVAGESYLRGSGRREVERLAARSSSIVLVDRYVGDEELVSWLASSEALVAAYLRASQSGLVPIARALGLPCIVSDAGALARQAHTGALPFEVDVVKAGDLASLVSALESRLARPLVARDRRKDGAAEFSAGWQRVVEAMGVGSRP